MADILSLLGAEGDSLLSYRCTDILKNSLYLPGPDVVDRVVAETDRKPGVLRALQTLSSGANRPNVFAWTAASVADSGGSARFERDP